MIGAAPFGCQELAGHDIGRNGRRRGLRESPYFPADASQWGIGGPRGRTETSRKPASASQRRRSSSEKTHPFSVVRAMLTPNRAENFGRVRLASVIMSRT
jgi:hypothetical protein